MVLFGVAMVKFMVRASYDMDFDAYITIFTM